MRGGHGSATETCIGSIGGAVARASARPRGSDVGFQTIARIDCDRTAATKGSNGIGAGGQGPDSVRGIIQRRWIGNGRAVRAGVTRGDHHHDAGIPLGFDGSLQSVGGTTLRRRADPGISGNVGSLGWIALR